MRKYLLPASGNDYKANLHCHTNVSDGRQSPEEMKADYMAQGYSIIAYTDHDILIPHPELAEENFLPLNSFEVEINAPEIENKSARKTCHICMIALEPHNLTMPFWHREKYLFGNALKHRDEVKFDESKPDYERVYSHEGISEIMKMGRDAGFFVTYNHPRWSQENYAQYSGYVGMSAMEVCNFSCCCAGYDDHNGAVYDDILREGRRIFCIAADDNHGQSDRFGGFTVIRADRLEYRTITRALEEGNFYASEGPTIGELWYEDGQLHVTCSDAREITLCKGSRRNKPARGENGAPINEATFPVVPDDVYVRVTVTDFAGNKAYTNAYFVDELMKEET